MDARGWLAAWGRDDAADAVEADIRAELEAHLELSEEALRAAGRTHDEARAEARARFGDLERTLRACRRVRLGGRHMLVRIQWVLIALLALATVTVTLHGRQSALEARAQADQARMVAQEQVQHVLELRSRQPVDEIIVGVGDTLTLHNEFMLRQQTKVQRDGQALFAGLGWIEVAGKSRPDLERALEELYAPQLERKSPIYVLVESQD